MKVVPKDFYHTLTSLSLAIWIMGDGNGTLDGGFKIATNGFTREGSQYLCNLLHQLYGIEAETPPGQREYVGVSKTPASR